MNILILNKYDNKGGAAIAAQRLAKSLIEEGQHVTMLVEEKTTNLKFVKSIRKSKFSKAIGKYKFLLEKIKFIPKEVNKEERFSFSTANWGNDLSKNKYALEADIFHIHWINHSFLSLKDLGDLKKMGKPIVVTMHDMWFVTGGCHHARNCINYKTLCGNCQFLKLPNPNDISAKQFLIKKAIYDEQFTFVGCSNWLSNLARESGLINTSKVLTIPNPIDIDTFKPINKKEAKLKLGLNPDKKHILFVSASVTNKRKGIEYLIKALSKLNSSPEKNIELLVLGNDKTKQLDFSFPSKIMGYITDVEKIALIYNASDVFVSPTLEDNLPNTIMESMSCGTPCVAFNIGGIPDLIDHKINGYISNYMDVDDLNKGINHVLSNPNYKNTSREKVLNSFSESIVAKKLNKLYKILM